MSQFTIKGKVIFITGANRGIGKALAEEAIARGAAKVYAASRKLTNLDSLVSQYKGKLVPVELDVTNEAQVISAAAKAKDAQVLINNAGYAGYTSIIASADVKPAREEMEINYFGPLNMTRAFAPTLKKNAGAALVNISSVAGLVGIPSFGTYSASKAAVHSLTQSARGEFKAHGIFVMGVYPGPIDTDMAAGVAMEKETPRSAAINIFNGLEKGVEDVYPDKVSRDFAAKFAVDAKAVEREWSSYLPQETAV